MPLVSLSLLRNLIQKNSKDTPQFRPHSTGDLTSHDFSVIQKYPILYPESSGFLVSGAITPAKTLEKWKLHSQKTWDSGRSAHASVRNGSENDSPRESLNLILSVVHTIKRNTIFSMIIYIHRFPERPSDDLSVSELFGSKRLLCVQDFFSNFLCEVIQNVYTVVYTLAEKCHKCCR